MNRVQMATKRRKPAGVFLVANCNIAIIVHMNIISLDITPKRV